MKYISDEELLSCGTAPGACWYAARLPAAAWPAPKSLQGSRPRVRARSQVAIDGDVLDISAFMDHHPGGPEIISELRERDAARCSSTWPPPRPDHARQFVVGKLQAVPRLRRRAPPCSPPSWLQPRAPGGRLVRNAVAAIVAAVLTAATAARVARMPRGRDALRLVYG